MIAPQKTFYQAGQRSVIEEAKAKVTTLDLAERVSGSGVRRGREVYFVCMLHDDHDPSLRVNPENGLWYCDPCGVGGDVVTLASLTWGYEKHEAAMAAAQLLHEFGYEIPQRPPSWFARQERQRDTRAAIEQTRKNIMRRRLFKYLVLPLLKHIEDDKEYASELERTWAEFKELLA